jgi:hypothetical protein
LKLCITKFLFNNNKYFSKFFNWIQVAIHSVYDNCISVAIYVSFTFRNKNRLILRLENRKHAAILFTLNTRMMELFIDAFRPFVSDIKKYWLHSLRPGGATTAADWIMPCLTVCKIFISIKFSYLILSYLTSVWKWFIHLLQFKTILTLS